MGESCPKLLDLIPNEKGWGMMKREDSEERRNGSYCDENKKLELRLGLPGDEKWSHKNSSPSRERNESILSLNHFTHHNPYLHHHHDNGLPVVVTKQSSQPCSTIMLDLQNAEKKAFSSASANTAVPNTSQKRAAPAPVVGWPPIRSFRKNLASSSSGKPVSELLNPSQTKPINEKPDGEKSHKGLFVKINMDGVPIGRKVDLNVCDTYKKLSSAVDELFRGLLAAQRDSLIIDNKHEEQKPITGLLDGSGEYTLVYEDNEGDRMLVGDVPWHMFLSTVKRLRVLKSSDLPTLGWRISKENKGDSASASK